MKICGSLALKLCICAVAAAPIAVPFTLPTLSSSPSAVVFQYNPPEPEPLPVYVAITASTGTSPALIVSVAPGVGTPASLFPQPAVTGDKIQVFYNITTFNQLASEPGIYTATINVAAAGFTTLQIPITFSIGSTLSIIPSLTSLTFDVPGPTSQTIQLSSVGDSSIGFSVAASTAGGGNWLSATASSGFTTATLTVTIAPLGVPGGTYEGAVTVTPTSGTPTPLVIPVTLQVGPDTLTASPTSLIFTYTVAGTMPAAQALQLSSTVPTDTYVAQTNSTGNWLLVNGATTNISGPLPATLNVTVNPTALAVGTYQGTITAIDAENGAQTVAVTLVISAVSTVANPTALVFVAQVGGAAPAAQVVAIGGFGSDTYTTKVTGAWISLSATSGSAPTQITVSANPVGLTAGTYLGQVEIVLNTHPQEIQVTFIVSPNPVLTTSPGGVFLFYEGGEGVLPPLILNVNTSNGEPQTFTVAPGLPDWLQFAAPGSSQGSPASLSFTVNAQVVATGTYVAEIYLIPAPIGGVAGVTVVVPILLQVTDAPGVVPSVPSLYFSAAAGTAAPSQTVEVQAASETGFTATTSTVSGGSWLSVTPTLGDANLATTLTVTADATSLAVGTYQGTVTMTTTGGVITQIAVTFAVTSSTVPFGVSPATLAFSYIQNAPVPAAQTLQVSGSQSFTASATTTTGGTWLAVTPASGTGNVALSVSVNPAGLAPGSYNGSIAVTPASGAALSVLVTLTVSGTGSLAAAPNLLEFAYNAGNPTPAAQTVSVSSAQAVAFTAAASSSGWLSVTPTSATTPATLTVSVNPANLGAGSYSGSIALNASGTAQLNITVTLTVNAPLPVINQVVNAASYVQGSIAPGEIVTVFGSSLGPAAGVGATIVNGFIPTTLANVQVTFNGYPGPILYAGAGQVNTIVPYELTAGSNASVEVVFGNARSNSLTIPVVAAAPGVFSADASGQGGGAILDVHYNLVSASNPVSPGSAIQIFATGQGQTSPAGVDGLIEPLTLPLPYPLLDGMVTIDNIPANILYIGAAPGLVAGALQVNVIVPNGLSPGAATLFISIGGIDSQTGITVAIQ